MGLCLLFCFVVSFGTDFVSVRGLRVFQSLMGDVREVDLRLIVF